MKTAYPVIISKDNDYFLASVPDLDIDTQGKSLIDAIEMARDAISIWCVCEQDDMKRTLPIPSSVNDVIHNPEDIVTLVDIDIDAYRRSLKNMFVKKTLKIPSWLNDKAVTAGINFSNVLQNALKEELQL